MATLVSKISFANIKVPGLKSVLEKIQDWPEIKVIIPALHTTAWHSGSIKFYFKFMNKIGVEFIEYTAKAEKQQQDVRFISDQPEVLKKKLDELLKNMEILGASK